MTCHHHERDKRFDPQLMRAAVVVGSVGLAMVVPTIAAIAGIATWKWVLGLVVCCCGFSHASTLRSAVTANRGTTDTGTLEFCDNK